MYTKITFPYKKVISPNYVPFLLVFFCVCVCGGGGGGGGEEGGGVISEELQ